MPEKSWGQIFTSWGAIAAPTFRFVQLCVEQLNNLSLSQPKTDFDLFICCQKSGIYIIEFSERQIKVGCMQFDYADVRIW